MCQCVCALLINAWARALSFSLSLSLSLSLMHTCTGGCGRTLRTPTLANNTQRTMSIERSMSMLGHDAGLRTLSTTQETPAHSRVHLKAGVEKGGTAGKKCEMRSIKKLNH